MSCFSFWSRTTIRCTVSHCSSLSGPCLCLGKKRNILRSIRESKEQVNNKTHDVSNKLPKTNTIRECPPTKECAWRFGMFVLRRLALSPVAQLQTLQPAYDAPYNTRQISGNVFAYFFFGTVYRRSVQQKKRTFVPDLTGKEHQQGST